MRFRTKRYLYEKYSRLHVEVYTAIKTSSNVKISAIFICSSANVENVDVGNPRRVSFTVNLYNNTATTDA